MINVKNFLDNLDYNNIVSEQVSQIFNDVSLEIQKNKAKNHNLNEEDANLIIEKLKVRPSLLVKLAEHFNCKTIAEVGTAQGLQSISFAKCIDKSKVYTCDIVDHRDMSFKENNNLFFVKGNSKDLSQKIKNDKEKIDMFWIDGAHDHYSVVFDFINLIKYSSQNSIWVFDDFDSRFGCFYDINIIKNYFDNNIVIELGKTASGNPNRILICY